MKLYCDGALNRICYKYEDCQPIILDLPKKVTNNTAEYLAIIAGLESAIRMRRKDITILSDSQLVVNQVNTKLGRTTVGTKEYYRIKKIHLDKLAIQVWRLIQKLDRVEFKWIKRDKNLAGIALETK